jgi:hypothetical protein
MFVNRVSLLAIPDIDVKGIKSKYGKNKTLFRTVSQFSY